VGRDQEAGEAEQGRNGERRTGVATEGNPSPDRCGDQRETSDAAEDTEIADENVVGEVVDQIGPRRPFGLRESVHLVDENADADPLQQLLVLLREPRLAAN
jgi:hypothetical protein